MATLYGQNFRILKYDTTAPKFVVVGMATNCTINLSSNTQEENTKDNTGRASMPGVLSRSWQVSVESLSMADIGAMLTAMKNSTKFKLLWDEVSTTNNQTPVGTTMARVGDAYLTDLTVNFNDRENSAKQLQFTGVAALDTVPSGASYQTISVSDTYTKGQFVRLVLDDDKVVASPKSLSLHVSVSLEDATTKDTEGYWTVQEPTTISYDISTTALIRSGETITSEVQAIDLSSMIYLHETGMSITWAIANVSGANNRTIGTPIVSGVAILTQLSIEAQNRGVARYTATFNGYGDYTVGS